MNKYLLSFVTLLICFVSLGQNNNSNPLILPGHNNDVNTAVFSSKKSNRLATAGWDNLINIYIADSPYNLVQTLSGHIAAINCLAYNLPGTMLASGGSDFTIMLWDSMYRRSFLMEDLTLRHQAAVNAIVFDRGGKYFFSGCNEGKLIIWDLINRKPVKAMNTGSAINDLCLSPNPANIFIACAEPKIKLFALAGGNIVRTLDGHTDVVNSLAISPNNLYLISGSNDKTARIWDLRNMKQLFVLPVGCWKVTSVAFSEDSKYCVTGCNDGSIKVWATETGKLVSSIEGRNDNIREINFSKNGQILAVAALLRGSKEYGPRIFYSNIPKPALPALPLKPLSAAQKAIDSIMSVRPLTRQDSIKYKSILMLKPTRPTNQKGAAAASVLDSTIIYKTPMNPAKIK